jgi:hypothetical protein
VDDGDADERAEGKVERGDGGLAGDFFVGLDAAVEILERGPDRAE